MVVPDHIDVITLKTKTSRKTQFYELVPSWCECWRNGPHSCVSWQSFTES